MRHWTHLVESSPKTHILVLSSSSWWSNRSLTIRPQGGVVSHMTYTPPCCSPVRGRGERTPRTLFLRGSSRYLGGLPPAIAVSRSTEDSSRPRPHPRLAPGSALSPEIAWWTTSSPLGHPTEERNKWSKKINPAAGSPAFVEVRQ